MSPRCRSHLRSVMPHDIATLRRGAVPGGLLGVHLSNGREGPRQSALQNEVPGRANQDDVAFPFGHCPYWTELFWNLC